MEIADERDDEQVLVELPQPSVVGAVRRRGEAEVDGVGIVRAHLAVRAGELAVRLVDDDQGGRGLRSVAKRVDARHLDGSRGPATCVVGHEHADLDGVQPCAEQFFVGLLDELAAVCDDEHRLAKRDGIGDDAREDDGLAGSGRCDDDDAPPASSDARGQLSDGALLVGTESDHGPQRFALARCHSMQTGCSGRLQPPPAMNERHRLDARQRLVVGADEAAG